MKNMFKFVIKVLALLVVFTVLASTNAVEAKKASKKKSKTNKKTTQVIKKKETKAEKTKVNLPYVRKSEYKIFFKDSSVELMEYPVKNEKGEVVYEPVADEATLTLVSIDSKLPIDISKNNGFYLIENVSKTVIIPGREYKSVKSEDMEKYVIGKEINSVLRSTIDYENYKESKVRVVVIDGRDYFFLNDVISGHNVGIEKVSVEGKMNYVQLDTSGDFLNDENLNKVFAKNRYTVIMREDFTAETYKDNFRDDLMYPSAHASIFSVKVANDENKTGKKLDLGLLVIADNEIRFRIFKDIKDHYEDSIKSIIKGRNGVDQSKEKYNFENVSVLTTGNSIKDESIRKYFTSNKYSWLNKTDTKTPTSFYIYDNVTKEVKEYKFEDIIQQDNLYVNDTITYNTIDIYLTALNLLGLGKTENNQ